MSSTRTIAALCHSGPGAVVQLLQRPTRFLERFFLAAQSRILATAFGHCGRVEQFPQDAGNLRGAVGEGAKMDRYAQAEQTATVVELIEQARHGQLRHAGGQGQSESADAAVMDEGGRPRQQSTQGREVEMANAGRQPRRELLAVR